MAPDARTAKTALIRRLRQAYAGELAAVRAYGGHWRSLRNGEQRAAVRQIRLEEQAHLKRIEQILAKLGSAPSRVRNAVFRAIGLSIAAFCFVGGWYAPMYGAGRLERRNIHEYEDAARLSVSAGHAWYAEEFLRMAEVEWNHERYFHDLVRGHWLHKRVGGWPDPPARSEIRASFEKDTGVVVT